MIEAVLTDYKIKELDMKNEIKNSGEIPLTHTFDFNVSYSKDKASAVAELTEYVKTADGSDQFHIILTVMGVFSMSGIDGSDSKKEAHVCCYDQLFPYASQIVSQLAQNSGINGLMLRKIPMKADLIVFGEKNDGKNGKMIEFPKN